LGTKKIIFIFSLVLTSLFVTDCAKKDEISDLSHPPSSQHSTLDRGEQIISEFLKRDFAPFRQSRMRFTITEKEEEIIYEVDVWRKQLENSSLTLTHIVKPTEDRDLSTLIEEHSDKETVVTTYIKSQNQFRETKPNKSFFGGVPTQELIGEWSKFKFTFLGEKELNGIKVFEVEGKLIPGKSSQADKMSVSFRVDNYLPAEIQIYNNVGKKLRTFRIKDYKSEANHPYISKTEIENHVFQTYLTVEVLSLSYPERIDDAFFTREKLQEFAQK